MSKHTKHTSARVLGNLMVVSGALIWSAGTGMQTEAQLSNQGAAIGTQVETGLTWVATETVFPAASQSTSPSGILALGMLMMLIGFGMHAWLILEKKDGKPVPVRIRKQAVPKKEVRKGRSTRRQAEVIWIERTIRF